MTADATSWLVPSPSLLLASVAATGGFLAWAAYSGLQRQRIHHFCAVTLSLLTLGWTLHVARNVGRIMTFEPLAFGIHMTFAYAATGALVATLATGLVRLLRPTATWPHRAAVCVFAGALVLAIATGAWMMSTGKRLQPPATELSDSR